MSRKFLVPIDLAKNELQNVTFQRLAGHYGSPVEGIFYYHNGDKCPYFYDGTTAIAMDPAKVPDAHIPLVKLATNPLARGNHTGTQAASTISDFDTRVRASRLDQMAAPTAAVSMNSQKITGLATPTNNTDAATKQYVDDTVASISWKNEVRVATTAAGTLASSFANGQVIDGITLITGDRILLKDQAAQADNGIYTVNASGAPTRATDADSDTDLKGAAVFVASGTTNGGTRWVCNTAGTITLGSTAITFVQFSGGSAYAAGDGLTLSSNTFNVGAGTGITVGADTVSVDTAVVVRKYAASFGDGAAISFVITHNLNTTDVTYSVRQTADGAFVECDAQVTSVNAITISVVGTPPAADALRVVVHG